MNKAVVINGTILTGEALVSIFEMVTNPNPKRWYAFERQGENVIVTVREDVVDPVNECLATASL